MIIGYALSPMSIGVSLMNNEYKPEVVAFSLLVYLITIPLCVLALIRCKKAKQQSDLIVWGIVSIFIFYWWNPYALQ